MSISIANSTSGEFVSGASSFTTNAINTVLGETYLLSFTYWTLYDSAKTVGTAGGITWTHVVTYSADGTAYTQLWSGACTSSTSSVTFNISGFNLNYAMSYIIDVVTGVSSIPIVQASLVGAVYTTGANPFTLPGELSTFSSVQNVVYCCGAAGWAQGTEGDNTTVTLESGYTGTVVSQYANGYITAFTQYYLGVDTAPYVSVTPDTYYPADGFYGNLISIELAILPPSASGSSVLTLMGA